MNPKRWCRDLGFGLLVLVCAAAAAPAQTPERESVPLELVRTLAVGLPLGHRALPEVLVGRLPEAAVRILPLPGDGRVVGSLVYPGYSMSAVAVPGTAAAVRDDWTARLLAAGWSRHEPPSRGGFESNPVENLPFCMGDSVTVSLGVSENPRGGSYVRVLHRTSDRLSVCRSEERPRRRGGQSLIPSLAPARGSITLGSGSGGGSGEWDARARIRTELTVVQLIDHYGSQLRRHGWAPLERTMAEGIGAETFRVTGPEGATWHGVLVASAPSPESDRFLTLRLTRVERSY